MRTIRHRGEKVQVFIKLETTRIQHCLLCDIYIYTFYKNVYLLCNYFIFTKTVVSIEISSSYGKKANLLKLRTLLLAHHPQYPFVTQLSASHARIRNSREICATNNY